MLVLVLVLVRGLVERTHEGRGRNQRHCEGNRDAWATSFAACFRQQVAGRVEEGVQLNAFGAPTIVSSNCEARTATVALPDHRGATEWPNRCEASSNPRSRATMKHGVDG
jgi:hypothetical protein